MGSVAFAVILAAFMGAAGAAGGWFFRGIRQIGERDLAGAGAQTSPSRRESPTVVSSDAARTAAAGLCMRTTFHLALGHRLAESQRTGDSLSIIAVQLDHFEALCDRHGIATSNMVLEAASKFFIAAIRGMDWVARLDMTTFAFLLPNTDSANAIRVAERLRNTISRCCESNGGHPIHLTISTGTTQAVFADTGETVLRRAEEAMEAALRAGGNASFTNFGQGVEAVGSSDASKAKTASPRQVGSEPARVDLPATSGESQSGVS